MKNRHQTKQERLEKSISTLLITGVIVSMMLEVAGLVLFMLKNNSLAITQTPEVFIRGSNFFTFIYEQISQNVKREMGIRLMTIGILVLMITPFLRVVLSVLYFAITKDWKYSVITLLVLIILTTSLMIH